MQRDRTRSLKSAIALSLEYMQSRQRDDGSWIDWDLPPGPSSIWTTAFVGCKLAGLPSSLKKRASVSTGLAAKWLRGKMFSDGGWGYNEEVGSDADSTALAILFLASQQKNIGEASYACLRGFQCADGGFATYREGPNLGSWAVSHTDVTPSAILAMKTQDGNERESVDRGLEFVLNRKNRDGIWESFWWTSCLYSTERSLALFKAVGQNLNLRVTRETLLQTCPQNPFESALLVSSLLSLPGSPQRQDIEPLIEELIDGQEPDGNWRSRPMLRVTRRDCLEAWKPGDSDPLFRDQNHLFTTATVIDALSRACSIL